MCVCMCVYVCVCVCVCVCQVGIHGWALLGGRWNGSAAAAATSTKLAERLATSVKQYIHHHHHHHHHDEVNVNTVTLSGHGLVLQRRDKFLKTLEGHRETLHDADIVLFACHSQGSTIAIIAVAITITVTITIITNCRIRHNRYESARP